MSYNTLVFLLMIYTTFVSSVRIKIALSSDDHQSAVARLKRQSSCSQARLISREMLNSPPFNDSEIPDEIISRLNNRVRFYYVVAIAITDIQMRIVQGIGAEDVTVARSCARCFRDGWVFSILLWRSCA